MINIQVPLVNETGHPDLVNERIVQVPQGSYYLKLPSFFRDLVPYTCFQTAEAACEYGYSFPSWTTTARVAGAFGLILGSGATFPPFFLVGALASHSAFNIGLGLSEGVGAIACMVCAIASAILGPQLFVMALMEKIDVAFVFVAPLFMVMGVVAAIAAPVLGFASYKSLDNYKTYRLPFLGDGFLDPVQNAHLVGPNIHHVIGEERL